MNWLNNLKIGKKLVIGFLVMNVLMVAIGITGFISTSIIDSRLHDIFERQLPSIDYLVEADRDLQQLLVAERSMIFANVGSPEFDKLVADYEENLKQADERWQKYKALASTAEEKALFTEYENHRKEWETVSRQIVDGRKEDTREGRRLAIDLSLTEASKQFEEMREHLNQLTDLNLELATKAEQDATTAFKSNTITMWATILGGVMVGLFISLGLTRAIARPMSTLSNVAESIARGDLSQNVDIHRKDEIGGLASAFRDMSATLRSKENVAQEIAKGNLNVDVQAASELDTLGKAMIMMRDRLQKSKEETEAALKDAQAKAAYLNNLAFPVLAVDTDMKVVYMNPAAAQVAGKPAESCIGGHCYDFLKNPHCQTENCAVAKSMKKDGFFTAETTLERQQLPIQYTGTPIKDANGTIIGATELAFDMTAVKSVVNEVNRTAECLKDGRMSERAKAGKAEGDYKKLVDGFNAAIDNIMKPVNEAVEVLSRMAKGDLMAQMTGDYKGDHAVMKTALNATLTSLNEILAQAKVAAEQVNTGAAQVSDSSQALSQGATKQASSLEEVTASMNEIGAQTKQNAENASQANQLAGAARGNADEGNAQMKQMLTAMEDISKSSQQISKIIKSIDEIAFQTNLLALNAAVEAARAGVHGKGFAVVAEEVRNLAQRSAKAAKETTELIENSVKSVGNGTRIAGATAKALEQIVTGITKAADLVGEIASASKEQAQGIDQVNAGLMQIDQVTQSNTANAEESAAASEELAGQSQHLQEMLRHFQLTNDSEVTVVDDEPFAMRMKSKKNMSELITINSKGNLWNTELH
jgi:methyl-accepting chemotaxis protein